MRFLHERFHATAGSVVEVTLSRRGANVMIMTDANFRHYERGEDFSYYGENFEGTLATLAIPNAGYWNLVVDLGGAPGTITATFSVIPGPVAPVTPAPVAPVVPVAPVAPATPAPVTPVDSPGEPVCIVGPRLTIGTTSSQVEIMARAALLAVPHVDGAYLQERVEGDETLTINVLAREHGIIERDALFRIEEELEAALGVRFTLTVRAHQGRDMRDMAGPNLLFARG